MRLHRLVDLSSEPSPHWREYATATSPVGRCRQRGGGVCSRASRLVAIAAGGCAPTIAAPTPRPATIARQAHRRGSGRLLPLCRRRADRPRYYEAATTSRRACPSAYGFALGIPHGLGSSCSPRRSRRTPSSRRARSLMMPALPGRLSPYGHERDLSGSLVTPPSPLPCSKTPAERVVLADSGFSGAAPGPNKPKASARS